MAPDVVLATPEFFFEQESKRIAADLHPEFKAIVPAGIVGAKDYAQQTNDADASDFEEALKSGALQPPDPQNARAAHLAAIKVLGRKEQQEADAKDEPLASDAALPSDSATSPLSTPQPSPSTAPAAPLPDEFPSEFAQYHRGARGYHSGDAEEMKKGWQALLDRPAAERKYRTTWAEYMLGKAALEAKAGEEARLHFKKTREAAKAGFADSLGLAAASIGWEAMMELAAEHYPEAARLYLEQLATGDATAVNSLRTLMEQLVEKQPDLMPLMTDPLMQRLATAMTLSGMGIFGGYDANDQTSPAHRWLDLLEKADAKQVKDADCVAWMYYQKGDYKGAERWLKVADPNTAHSLWLKAKLAMRDGKLDLATQLLSRAVPKLPPEHDLESRHMEYEVTPGDTSKGDLGALRMGRSEFIAAAKLFLQVPKSDDAEYIAEAVLTLPELKSFIETELPEQAPKTDTTSEERDPAETRGQFQAIVGRRLVRAGKLAEARAYFPEHAQKVLDEYVPFLSAANDARATKADRAKAFWAAAELIQDGGGALFDYALPAAMAERSSGRAVEEPSYPEIAITYGKPQTFIPPITAAERTRVRQNSAPALRRQYSIYHAADLGWRAAALLPENDDHTAEVLNTAGSWLKNRDEKAADRFYQAIERRCSRTELGKEAIKRHWFVPISTPSEESDSSADDTPEPESDGNATEAEPTP